MARLLGIAPAPRRRGSAPPDRRAAPHRLPLLAAVAVLALAGCAGPESADPEPTSPESSSPTATPTEPEPTPSPAPDDSGDEEPATAVPFTGTGVGDVLDGTPDALAPVEALLGPADTFEESPFADCGAPWISAASWGPVSVTFNEGALFGWQVDGQGPVPETIALPHDIQVGDAFSAVTALPGAAAPEFIDNYQVYMVALDDVQWWADDDAPESPVTVIGHSIVGCG